MKIPDFYTGSPDNETDTPDNTGRQTDFYHAQMDNFSCHPDRGIRTFELKSPCPDDKNPQPIVLKKIQQHLLKLIGGRHILLSKLPERLGTEST